MLLAGWERLSYIQVKPVSPAASQHQMWEQPRMHFHLCRGCGSCAANVPAVVGDVFSAGWEWQSRAGAGISK